MPGRISDLVACALPLVLAGRLAAAVDPAPPLPSWVPAANTVVALTPTNTFRSVIAPWFEGYHSVTIANAYSGGFLNPYFGPYGACLFFGGGHAACNDNSVIALVLGADSCTFHRMTDPSPIYGSDPTALVSAQLGGAPGPTIESVRAANSIATTLSAHVTGGFAALRPADIDAHVDPVYAELTIDGQPC